MKITEKDFDIIITNFNNFDIVKTFECGQCFRWQQLDDGYYIGIINGRIIKVKQTNNEIIFKNSDLRYFNMVLKPYFDLDRNYQEINDEIQNLDFIGKACKYSNGIRILKQEPWEALISFIISQNNNIPRIKKIITRLCENFGTNIIDDYFAFPTLNQLKNVTIEDLAILKCGFRDKYIIDAIQKVKNREIILNDLYEMPIEEAKAKLMTIKGVGNKVADCTLLYGFGRTECFPVDTWIKKTMTKHFPNGLPKITPEYLGIVQQYIFYYSREIAE